MPAWLAVKDCGVICDPSYDTGYEDTIAADFRNQDGPEPGVHSDFEPVMLMLQNFDLNNARHEYERLMRSIAGNLTHNGCGDHLSVARVVL
eukprot:SAG11_NODE_213_length_12262_cov_8.391597_7_plen_91_part_00